MKRNKDSDVLTEDPKGLDPTPDSNPDPITKEPGSHPIGVAAGGTGGAAAGGAIGGAIGGPVGAVVGAAVGAVGGAFAGKGAAEVVNPTEENAYWQKNYSTRPYYKSGESFDTYEPAYRYGYETASRPEYHGKKFEDVESDLATNWPTYSRTNSNFNDYRLATRDAYNRVQDRVSNLGRETADKSDSVWEQVKGNWKQFKGSVKEKWNLLTDDDLEAAEGRREKIVGKIQERYGEAKWKASDIDREVTALYNERFRK